MNHAVPLLGYFLIALTFGLIPQPLFAARAGFGLSGAVREIAEDIAEDKRRARIEAANAPGRVLWIYGVGYNSTLSPALGSDGTIYAVASSGYLFAVSPEGKTIWFYSSAYSTKGSPVVGPDGTIYFTDGRPGLNAVAPDGALKWSVAVASTAYTPSVGPDGSIYVPSQNGNLYAFSSTGAAKWAFTAGGPLYSSPAVDSEGTVYFGARDQRFYAVTSTGGVKWSLTGTSDVNSSPAIGSDGTIYFTSMGNALVAASPAGSIRWIVSPFNLGGIGASPVIGPDGTIYVVGPGTNDPDYLNVMTGQSALVAYDTAGQLKWRYYLIGDVNSTPAIGADGTVYVACQDGIYAISSAGTLRWKLPGAYSFSSPALSDDGLLLVGSTDLSKGLQSIQTGTPLAHGVWPRYKGNKTNDGRAPR